MYIYLFQYKKEKKFKYLNNDNHGVSDNNISTASALLVDKFAIT